MPKPNLPAAVMTAVSVVLSVALTACASVAPTSPAPSVGGSSPSPSPIPTVAGIDHPTGSTDVILRMEVGGGFMAPDFIASQAPTLSLFGDGKVIFQQQVDVFPEPGPDGIIRNRAWRIGQLDEDQVQELLAFALGPGGLGTARESYVANGIADAPDTTFTINAGGVVKTVVVNALGMDTLPTQADGPARTAFQALATRLIDFDRGGTIDSDVYNPTSYRGVLSKRDPDPSVKAVSWPWSDFKPADFSGGSDNGSGGVFMARRMLSADDVATLGLGDVAGGIQGLVLSEPDGKLFGLILRPLLPDETS
jgi:hypothetical protein